MQNPNRISLILLDISPYLCHIPAIKFLTGGDMGYKKIDRNMTFAEVSLLKSMEHNRSLKRLEKINQVINLSLIHISEPTRLGMISYAVFCLKKKKNKKNKHN